MGQRRVETGTDDLVGHVDGAVGVLAFDRPDRRNALSEEMYDGFRHGLADLVEDPAVRVVVVTGRGGAFCAGGDVKGMNERNSGSSDHAPTIEESVDRLRRNQISVSAALHELPKPVIAALPGPAAGAGLSIALAADLRVASERAVLVTAFSNVGASGDFGGSWFLTQLVGPSRARELYFLSERLTAGEALELGIVNRVLPDDGFDEAALDLARRVAERPPLALRAMKENLNRALVADLRTCLDAEATAMVRTMATADHREAAAAFVEKRPPHFVGR
ncbi:MAG: enoyl-CoA hydratase-related protein [Actinomycetota bacterium]